MSCVHPDSEVKNEKVTLLLIDPQVDFHPNGSLQVPGANEDSDRIVDMIISNMGSINEIFVTLDSHHPMHIAHPGFWENAAGESPNPFTPISHSDVANKLWMPRIKSLSVAY